MVRSQDLVDAFGGADHVVGPEVEHRRLLRPDLPVDRRLHPSTVLLEHLDDRFVAGLARQRVEVDDGTVELVVDVDVRDRDELEPLVVDPHELVGEDLAQRLAEPGATWILVPAGRQASACSHRVLLGER